VNSWKVILAAVVIFGAGVVTGGLVVNHALRKDSSAPAAAGAAGPATVPGQTQARDLLRKMDRELNLSAAQRERIQKLISESQEHTKALWKPVAPQMARETQSLCEGIRLELTPEQSKKFDEIIKPRRGHRGEDSSKPWDKEDRRGRPARKPAPADTPTNAPQPEPERTNTPALKPEPVRL
jgi:Spy/CpxP family protein refolding chaperone